MRRTTDLPRAVRLHFLPARQTPAHEGPNALSVEARSADVETRDIVWLDTPRGMGEWLQRHGFRYVPGTQAVWTRPEPSPLSGVLGPFGLHM